MSALADRLDEIAADLDALAHERKLDVLELVADDLRDLARREHDAWVAALAPWPVPAERAS